MRRSFFTIAVTLAVSALLAGTAGAGKNKNVVIEGPPPGWTTTTSFTATPLDATAIAATGAQPVTLEGKGPIGSVVCGTCDGGAWHPAGCYSMYGQHNGSNLEYFASWTHWLRYTACYVGPYYGGGIYWVGDYQTHVDTSGFVNAQNVYIAGWCGSGLDWVCVQGHAEIIIGPGVGSFVGWHFGDDLQVYSS